mmetsp:Transcript_79119/g.109916  ORF Transcript_79119/g.109916 Transcript_79119/m.109916 type:complete len:226 (+) Transcript_79119:1176-1853(+)
MARWVAKGHCTLPQDRHLLAFRLAMPQENAAPIQRAAFHCLRSADHSLAEGGVQMVNSPLARGTGRDHHLQHVATKELGGFPSLRLLHGAQQGHVVFACHDEQLRRFHGHHRGGSRLLLQQGLRAEGRPGTQAVHHLPQVLGLPLIAGALHPRPHSLPEEATSVLKPCAETSPPVLLLRGHRADRGTRRERILRALLLRQLRHLQLRRRRCQNGCLAQRLRRVRC